MSTDTHLINAALKNSTGKPLNLTIKDGSVTNTKLSKDAVSTDKIQNEAVTEEKISSEALKSINDKASEASKEAATKADEARERMEQTMNSMKEVIDSSAIKDDGGNLVPSPFKYVQNKEFIFAMVDAEDKLLAGIQWDGTPVHGKTSSIEDKMQSQIDLIANRVATIIGDEDTTNVIDTMNELKTFFANIENTETLTGILTNLDNVAKNLDKTTIKDEEGNIQDTPFKVIENEEFIHAITDSEDRLLFGIYRETGKPYFPLNEMYHVEQNEEFFAVWLDEADHVLLGIRRDGEIIGEIHAVNALKQVISQLQSDVATLQEMVGTIDASLQEILSVFSLQDNDEYLAVETDADGKVISATNADGSHYIHKVKSETIPTEFEHIEDPEGRMEITIDADDKVLGYRDSEGTRHEHMISVNDIELGKDARSRVISLLKNDISFVDAKVHLNLPHHGKINILEETFFLTYNDKFSTKEDVIPIQVAEATSENLQKGVTLYKYFIKSTLTQNDGSFVKNGNSISLDLYVPSKVSELKGNYYVTSSLSKNEEGAYEIKEDSIRVTKIVDAPFIDAWDVNKKIEHQCKVVFDFKDYLSGTYYVGVKLQGSSTLYRRKKNLRFTLYKDSIFSKKEKVKIGEMIEASSFNAKAYNDERSMINEPLIYRLYLEARYYHTYSKQFPWNDKYSVYTSATGCILSFPVTVYVNGEFGGVMFFGNKKDKDNYNLGNDSDGMIVSGLGASTWFEYTGQWEDEMNDNITDSNVEALKNLHSFLSNDANITKEEFEERFYVEDWIDYYIFITTFRMRDNDQHNMVLYSSSDKKKFSPFLYDCDLSLSVSDGDFETVNPAAYNKSVWKILKRLYWKDICERYTELRQTIFTYENAVSIVRDIQSSVPYTDYKKEYSIWGENSEKTTKYRLDSFKELLNIYDKYFV